MGDLTGVVLADVPDRPLLLLGPSLGTSAEALWSRCVDELGGAYHVVGWELPGHGRGAPPTAAFGVADLARGVLGLADRLRPGAAFGYAGVSAGGAVGLQLLLDAPRRVTAAALLCTAARIGEAAGWHERAATVRTRGTAALVEASAGRWFAPGFAAREPVVAGALLDALRAADAAGYAGVCEALAGFDVRTRLAGIDVPVVAVAGGDDRVTPTAGLAEIASGVRHGRLVVLDGVAHLAPAERPAAVAALLREVI
ncbi:alpha/beta fold hydrolase [Dactylosporangium sp. NPDC049140]|uniref:alpha/beta fold hydrolase n=1 Tax=Dactylosporangium sp. NPDC049140 TaxID=3155647 RepID=UPI0033F4627B